MTASYGKRLSAFALVVALCHAELAFADTALIENIGGKVLLRHNGAISAAVDHGQMSAGDQVVLGQEGQATLRFATCSLTLKGPNMFTLGTAVPCAAGTEQALSGGVFVTPVSGAASQFAMLDQINARGQAMARQAQQAHDMAQLRCVNQHLADAKALRHFLMRNPGVNDSERIQAVGNGLEGCGHVAQAVVPEQAPVVQPVPPPQAVVPPTPALDSTGLLIGGGVAAAAVAGGAFLLLSKSNTSSASAP